MARSSLQTSWLTDSAEGAPLVPPTHQRPSQGQCGGFVDRAVGHGDGVAQAARSGARAARVGGGAGGNSARRCASVGAGPHDRSPRTPELHRPPRTGIAKKKSATSVGSRSAAPAPAAGSVCWRSSLSRRAPRARETAARVVNALPWPCCCDRGVGEADRLARRRRGQRPKLAPPSALAALDQAKSKSAAAAPVQSSGRIRRRRLAREEWRKERLTKAGRRRLVWRFGLPDRSCRPRREALNGVTERREPSAAWRSRQS
jgi:hypothetical protein